MVHQTIKKLLLFSAVVSLFYLGGCYYDNEEDLYPIAMVCDTIYVTYSGTIAPIMANNCNTCHSSGAASGGIVTDNYDDLKINADNGRLWGAVNHDEGYVPMPQNGPKLNECNLAKIRIWIDEGALNN